MPAEAVKNSRDLIQRVLAGNQALDLIANADADLECFVFIACLRVRNFHYDEAAVKVVALGVGNWDQEIEGLASLSKRTAMGLFWANFSRSLAEDFLPIFEAVILAMMTLSVVPGGTACRPSLTISS